MAVLFTPGSLVLSRALSCAEGAGMCLRVCVRKCVHACVKEWPLATAARVHMLGFSAARRALGHFEAHRHTHTHNQRAASFMEIRAVSSPTG